MPDFQHREMEHPIREDGDGRGGESEPVEDYSDAVDTIEVLDPADIRISTKHPTVEIVVDRLRSDNILVTPRFPMGGRCAAVASPQSPDRVPSAQDAAAGFPYGGRSV